MSAMRQPLCPSLCERSEYWTCALMGGKPPIHDDPMPGYYRRRLVRGGPWVPVKIWIEQETGDDGELLGEPVARCLVNDRSADAGEQWLWCAAQPISHAEYLYLLDMGRWAAAHEPDEPLARPNEKPDLLRVRPPF